MDKVQVIAELLSRTGAAHGGYEMTVLNGVYDEAWPDWYAAWAIEHGLNDWLSRSFETQELSQLFYEINEAHKQTDNSLSWAEFTAQKLVTL